MGRWTVFLYLLIFYGYTASQPTPDDIENARPSRQLDFGECCPCPRAGQDAPHDFTAQEFSRFSGEGSSARARNLDDCPCRDRHPDSEGASSIFFPTSMRSDGPVVRPLDNKEELKPLLQPEVDLASSVLQTLREATDEEYQDALVRDAARSMAKVAEETTFGDATPEASTGNIFTIIVNPKQSDNLDDVIPQESRVQESRCINDGPIRAMTTDFGKRRVSSKPPSLLREFFGLPRINKPAGLLHRNLLDMDSSSGASNIQERALHFGEGRVSNTGIQGLKKYAPLLKFDSNMQNNIPKIKNNLDKDFSLHKVPDLKWSMNKKLKDLQSSKSSLGDIGKISPSPLIPKMRFINSLSKSRGNNIEDQSESPTNIQEQTAKHSFFDTKSHLENIFEKHRPVGLKNLLKLKDVELIPLKDIVHKSAERPKFTRPNFIWPTIFNKEKNLIPIKKNKYPAREAKATEITGILPITNTVPIFDHEVSPSNAIERIHEQECPSRVITTTEKDIENAANKISSPEITDAVPSSSNIQTDYDDKLNDLNKSQSDEFIDNSDDCDIKTLSSSETDRPQPKESLLDVEIQKGNQDTELDSGNTSEFVQDSVEEQLNRESNDVSNEENCVNNNNDEDSMTDSSNNVNKVLKLNDTVPQNSENFVNQNIVMQEAFSREQEENGNLQKGNQDTELDSGNTSEFVQDSVEEQLNRESNDVSNEEICVNNNNDEDSMTDSSNNVNKVSKLNDTVPQNSVNLVNQNIVKQEAFSREQEETSNDDLKDVNESSDKMSMQDLQKISDSMLQQEAQEQKSKSVECSLNEITEPEVPLEVSSKEIGVQNFEESANTQYEVVMDPKNSEFNAKNTCHSGLTLPKQTIAQPSDTNLEASDVVFSRMTPSKNIIESTCLKNEKAEPQDNYFNLFKTPRLALQDVLKPVPLPTLDDIKLTLTSLFDNDENARDVEVFSRSEVNSLTDTTDILNPLMATDASTTKFSTSLPPSRLEELDLDFFQLKPQSGSLSKIPKIDLHSYKTKLPLPKSLVLKPIKLQSALEDKSHLLGASLTIGQNNRPSDRNREPTRVLDDFKARMKSNNQKSVKTPLKLNNLQKGVINQGIGDISDKWKNMQHIVESKFSKTTKKPVNIQSHDLLDAISRNHEDVNDKLRALHIDFNDRIETLRNNLFDKKLGTSESPNKQTNLKSLSTFINQDRSKGLLPQTGKPKRVTGRREPKKILTPRKLEKQKETGIRSSQRLSNQKTFKMPASASVPVPRTIEVPELKTTSTKSPKLLIQRTSDVDPYFRNINAPQVKESMVPLLKPVSKKSPKNPSLGKHIKPFTDSKIKVTFSTTPRSTIITGVQFPKIAIPSSHFHADSVRNQGRFQFMEDHNALPSEISNSIMSPITNSQQNQFNLLNAAIDSENRHTSRLNEEPTSAEKLSTIETLDVGTKPKNRNDLKAWPKASESAFLMKVKEAVKARLSKVNPPITLKRTDNVLEKISFSDKEEALNTDMARSASENTEIIEREALKENVSYKCTMVCTKQ